MMYTERGEAARQSEPQKVYHSTDWSLKPDSMKVESLVIAHQNGAVNTFPGLVHTARHTTRVDCTRSRRLNLLERGAEGVNGKGGEVVTR